MKTFVAKSFLLLPVMACSIALSSCNVISMKEPSFEHYENEIAYEDVKDSASLLQEIVDSGSSLDVKSEFYQSYKKTSTSSGVKTTTGESFSYKTQLKIDSNHQTAQKEESYKAKGDITSKSYIDSKNISSKKTINYQTTEIDGTNYLIQINKKAKIYATMHSINETYNFQSETSELLNDHYTRFRDYEQTFVYYSVILHLDGAKYYLDGSVYTIVANYTLSDGTDNDAYETTTSLTIQYDFKEKMFARASIKVRKVYSSYDYYDYEEETIRYFKSSLKKKDTTVSKVNIYKYDRVLGDIG